MQKKIQNMGFRGVFALVALMLGTNVIALGCAEVDTHVENDPNPDPNPTDPCDGVSIEVLPCIDAKCVDGVVVSTPVTDHTRQCGGYDMCGSPLVCIAGRCASEIACECPDVNGNPCMIGPCDPLDNGSPCVMSNDACIPPGTCQSGMCVTSPPAMCSNQGEVCLQGACARECAAPLSSILAYSQSTGGLAAADFDGDGKADLAIIADNDIHVRLATSFGQDNPLQTGLGGSLINANDLDGDGSPDLLVANFVGMNQQVTTLRNLGNGSFAAPVVHATYELLLSLTSADFNGDGKADFATATSLSVGVHMNNGNGTFAAKVEYAPNDSPSSVDAGDFNGDGHIDLVLTSRAARKLVVLFNNGQGVFSNRFEHTLNHSPASFAIADFNGDGSSDIAIAGDRIEMLLNNGMGAFISATEMSWNKGPIDLIATDLNGDGIMDLATTNSSPPSMTTWLNQGNGTFGDPTWYVAGMQPGDLVATDVDGDAMLDLAFANSGDATVRIIHKSCMN